MLVSMSVHFVFHILYRIKIIELELELEAKIRVRLRLGFVPRAPKIFKTALFVLLEMGFIKINYQLK